MTMSAIIVIVMIIAIVTVINMTLLPNHQHEQYDLIESKQKSNKMYEGMEAFYPTPEGDIEVTIMTIDGDRADVIWNERCTTSGCIIGRCETIPLAKLRAYKSMW
jgi:hypothetical protein